MNSRELDPTLLAVLSHAMTGLYAGLFPSARLEALIDRLEGAR